MAKLLTLFVVAFAIALGFALYKISEDAEPPTLPEFYWGPSANKGKQDDESIRPFKIAVPDKVLEDLKTRLKREVEVKRLQKPLEEIGFEYGFNSEYLEKVGKHWLEKYDWRSREKTLNKFDMFLTKVSGIDVHFLRVKSKHPNKYKETKPLLLVHGWPGSFVEFIKIIPLLTDPPSSQFNFELIIPSIPGYGYSEAPHVTGFGIVQAAQLFHKLMHRLGFEKYFVQGGDWGALITTEMAALYPNEVKGLHSNMCVSLHPKSSIKNFIAHQFPSYFLEEDEQDGTVNLGALLRETGYLHLQATKPDTIGAAISQTPLGLAAYILEKFSTWTRPSWSSLKDGGLSNWNLDELLDNLMIYWVTNSITSSMRFYAESLGPSQRQYGMDRVPVKVPTGCFNSKNEFASSPKFILGEKFHNLLQYSSSKDFGHFAAFEAPTALAADIIKFVSRVR